MGDDPGWGWGFEDPAATPVANVATSASGDTPNWLSEMASRYSLSGNGGAGGDGADRLSLGVDSGSGASGLRLASEASAPAVSAPQGGSSWGDWVKSYLAPAGDVAKAVSPLLGMGAGVMGAVAARDAAQRAARQEPIIREATQTQIDNAKQGQGYAKDAAALSQPIQNIAARMADISPQIAAAAPEQAQRARDVESNVVAPQIAYATDLLTRARAGQLPDAYEAEIEKWKAGARQQLLSFLAKSGQTESTSRVSLEQEIESKAQAMRADALRKMETSALTALNQAQGGYTAAGNLTASSAQITGASADPLSRSAAAYGGAAVPLGTAGSILAGSSSGAATAGRTAQIEEQSLEALIAQAMAQLGRASGRAA